MSNTKIVIAIAGPGDLAKYFVTELLATDLYTISLLSRSPKPWFTAHPGVTLHLTDYSHDSILSILDATSATVLFSFLHSNEPSVYNIAHEGMLSACRASHSCKRFVPSEYGGNIDEYPFLPRFYAPTHAAFRESLRGQSEIQWTLVNIGWFADYFVQPVGGTKSYMKALPGVWPIDLERWTVTVLGEGEEKIAWTAARDVAKALVRLVEVPQWEENTYVCGEIGTWNEAIAKMEKFHGKRFKNPFGGDERHHKSAQTIHENIARHASDPDPSELYVAYMDEWNITGASAVPWEKVLAQRRKYFEGIRFRTVEEVLQDADIMGIV